MPRTLDEQLSEAVAWVQEHAAASTGKFAIGVPAPSPYAGLLRQRLMAAGLAAPHVVGGMALRGTVIGIRLRQLLRALGAGLQANELIELLPYLRRGRHAANEWELRLSRNRAAALVFESGSAAAPQGPRRWAQRLRERADFLRHAVDASAGREAREEAARRTLTAERHQAERWLHDVTPLLPAIAALDNLAEQVETEIDMLQACELVREFCETWMSLPPDPAHGLQSFVRQLRQAASSPAAAGVGRLAFLEAQLDAVRVETSAAARVWIVVDGETLPDDVRVAHRLEATCDIDQFRVGIAPLLVRDGDDADVSGPLAALPSAATDSQRARALALQSGSPQWTASDGNLRAARSLLSFPGLSKARPLSASGLAMFLSCPYRFLLHRVLRWHQFSNPVVTEYVDPIHQGILFHAAADQLLQRCGAALCARQGDLSQWLAGARSVADASFESEMRRYPLWGTENQVRERERLHAQLAALVTDEWNREPRTFAASEWRFGEPEATALSLPDGGTLYVRGSIDRIDLLSSGALSVRDLKTGYLAGLDRQSLSAARDLQLGIYVLVLEQLGCAGSRRVEEAAYVRASAGEAMQRRFAGADLDSLRARTTDWLATAHALLSSAAFPRTPQVRDCQTCPFVPVCGDGAQARSAVKLNDEPADEPLRMFRMLKADAQREFPAEAGR